MLNTQKGIHFLQRASQPNKDLDLKDHVVILNNTTNDIILPYSHKDQPPHDYVRRSPERGVHTVTSSQSYVVPGSHDKKLPVKEMAYCVVPASIWKDLAMHPSVKDMLRDLEWIKVATKDDVAKLRTAIIA